MNLAFFGPPGSGKGTQAKLVAEKNNWPHISLGDMLREEVRLESSIGKRAKEIMNAGNLVPDELTIELTRQRLSQADAASGFIVDGFPRSQAQAEAFDQMLNDLKINLDAVVFFQISVDQVVERLTGRRSCKSCGAVFHVKFKQPKVANICDSCGGSLYQRHDDQEEAIRTRFKVYSQQTEPLLERYKAQGKLVTLSADQAIDKVTVELLKITGNG